VLIPAYSVVLALLTYFVYFALALFGTPAFSDMSSIIGTCASPRAANKFTCCVDSRAHLPPVNAERNSYAAFADKEVVPELYDIPIGLVNRVLYDSRDSRANDLK
jgi:phosphatidylinositol glycan class P protein